MGRIASFGAFVNLVIVFGLVGWQINWILKMR